MTYILIIFVLLAAVLFVWAVVDCVSKSIKNPRANKIWAIWLFFFFPIIGPIVYFQLIQTKI